MPSRDENTGDEEVRFFTEAIELARNDEEEPDETETEALLPPQKQEMKAYHTLYKERYLALVTFAMLFLCALVFLPTRRELSEMSDADAEDLMEDLVQGDLHQHAMQTQLAQERRQDAFECFEELFHLVNHQMNENDHLILPFLISARYFAGPNDTEVIDMFFTTHRKSKMKENFWEETLCHHGME
eukprot:scaffold4929_cov176-Amphora_coffeaeformis.AAC.9